MKLALSILDQTPIRHGSNAKEALAESIELIRLADSEGFTRYWISEHHNFQSLAAAAPEVLLARLGAETTRIRIGSGGIMLPNHSALKVAENFRLLEALYPGRVDLGLGRAPGGDRLTASLLNPSNTFDPKEYVEQIVTLNRFLRNDHSPDTIHEKVKAIPVIDTVPELWMLTSSGESAYLAAHFGMVVSFAAFINPVGGPEAIEAYKKRFVPSDQFKAPQASVGIFAFCSDDEEKVKRMQAIMDYRLLSISKGVSTLTPSYDTARKYTYSSDEWRMVLYNRSRMIVGNTETAKQELVDLAERYDVEEVVVATFAETAEDRLESYSHLAKMFLTQAVEK